MELQGTSCPIQEGGECVYKEGALPDCAPLALAYVPMQASASPAYETAEALRRGTLFPGLDLPFMNIVNTRDVTDTPMGELMAICFVAHELQLYLDTHPEDEEAFETLRDFLKLSAEAQRRYVARYGPISPENLANCKTFTWLKDPWPWQYQR